MSVTATCATGQRKISWNNLGPAGPTGPQGPQGATGPQGPQGPPGVTSGYESSRGDNVEVNGSAVGSLSLPAGTFIVNAAVPMWGLQVGASAVECWLKDGNGSLATGWDALAPAPDSTGANAEGDITMTGTTTVGGTVTVQCSLWGNATVFVEDMYITAIPVSTAQISHLAHLSPRPGFHAPPLSAADRAAPAASSRGVSSAGHH